MPDAVSGIVQKQLSSNALGAQNQQSAPTQTGRSFENVLQNGSQQSAETSGANGVPGITGDRQLDAMRIDLTNRLQNLPNGVPAVTAILPEWLNTKTSMGGFKQILNDALNSGLNKTGQGKGVIEKFTGVETEMKELDSIMRSNKDLSQGELLSLQARLYQVSQHIDVLSKVVDQMTGGVKTVLNTNV